MKPKKKSIGFSFAFNGLKEVIRSERNFKIHLIITFFIIVLGLFLEISLIEWSIIILVIGLVLTTEIINSSIERIIDYIKPDIHPAAKVIKDMGASAVLISAMISVIIGLIVFLPKMVVFLHQFLF